MTPKTSNEKPGKPEKKPKSPEAQRAVMKPQTVNKDDTTEIPWKGGVDRFSERV